MKNLLFIIIALSLFSAGCKKSDNSKIDGVWQEKSVFSKYGGTRYWIRINADLSFEMKLNRFTDAIDVGQPCSGNRTDYVKGTYTFSNREIVFNGSYCNATFNQQQANCEGISTFQTRFTYTFMNGDLVLDFEKADPYKIWLVRE